MLTDIQITKQIVKVEGQKVFEGLLSVTNEFGQIRICDLVPTKAHSQFDIALSRIRDSAETYGLEQPQIFYTDNMADKSMLEKHFPSLRNSIQPITKHGSLPLFRLPSDVEIKVTKHAGEMQDIVFTLLDGLGPGEKLVIGLDTEWNVDLNAHCAGVPDRR